MIHLRTCSGLYIETRIVDHELRGCCESSIGHCVLELPTGHAIDSSLALDHGAMRAACTAQELNSSANSPLRIGISRLADHVDGAGRGQILRLERGLRVAVMCRDGEEIGHLFLPLDHQAMGTLSLELMTVASSGDRRRIQNRASSRIWALMAVTAASISGSSSSCVLVEAGVESVDQINQAQGNRG